MTDIVISLDKKREEKKVSEEKQESDEFHARMLRIQQSMEAINQFILGKRKEDK